LQFESAAHAEHSPNWAFSQNPAAQSEHCRPCDADVVHVVASCAQFESAAHCAQLAPSLKRPGRHPWAPPMWPFALAHRRPPVALPLHVVVPWPAPHTALSATSSQQCSSLSHAEQDVTGCDVSGENRPGAQLMQLATPGAFWYFPGGHAVHLRALPFPTSPCVLFPAAQSMQPALPCESWYLPAAQSMQAWDASDGAYLPLGQSWHCSSSSAPSPSVTDPGTQATQASCPALAWKRPEAHSAHPVLPGCAAIVPGPQAEHAALPALAAYRPLAHGWQAEDETLAVPEVVLPAAQFWQAV
jgi:hypothetical protein